jgi:chemotaxis protein MotB
MSGRNRHGQHQNHERWLISYADFITLLFAFFVVMFAVSQSDKSKPKDVSASVKRAIEGGGVSSTLRSALQHEPAPKPPSPGAPPVEPSRPAYDLLPSFNYLSKQLEKEIESGKLKITVEERGIVISLRERAFFPSGEELVDPAAYDPIEKIATLLSNLPNPVRLEGHTDSKPIHTSRFRNNWELSSARAIAVLLLLEKRYGLPSSRFAVAGYADNAPVAANDSDEGRAQNRRVDIVILDRSTSLQTEASARPRP